MDKQETLNVISTLNCVLANNTLTENELKIVKDKLIFYVNQL